jgi:Holliday junction resolvase RusA-like endonuclease
VIKIIIPEAPVPKGRHQRTFRGGRIWEFTPKKTREYEYLVSQIALLHKPKKLLTGALSVIFCFFRPIPKSFSKKDREWALSGRLRPKTKPDLTNYTKAVEDALNGIIWKDDSQIVDGGLHKFYSDNPRTEMLIKEIENET